METARPNALLCTGLLHLAGPLALYYGAQAVGLGVLVAGLIGLVPPVGNLVSRLAMRRELSGLDLFGTAVLMVGALVGGAPELVPAKDGIATAAAGIAALVSLRCPRPLCFPIARPFGENWDDHWNNRPGFRALMRTITAVWGGALLADAGARVAIACTLPMIAVPLLSDLQYAALIGGLILLTVRCTKRACLISRAP